MSVKTRDWLKFGTLVVMAFALGLAFASAFRLPSRGEAAGAGAGTVSPSGAAGARGGEVGVEFSKVVTKSETTGSH